MRHVVLCPPESLVLTKLHVPTHSASTVRKLKAEFHAHLAAVLSAGDTTSIFLQPSLQTPIFFILLRMVQRCVFLLKPPQNLFGNKLGVQNVINSLSSITVFGPHGPPNSPLSALLYTLFSPNTVLATASIQ